MLTLDHAVQTSVLRCNLAVERACFDAKLKLGLLADDETFMNESFRVELAQLTLEQAEDLAQGRRPVESAEDFEARCDWH